MEPQDRIFRQAALDKLSSPEQLDQLMQVTTPKSWLALAACGALVLTAVVWGVFGSLPTSVSGRGILIRQGGVFVATSRSDGNVLQILVREGGLVTNDQVVAVVSQPELDLRIRQGVEAQQRLERELRDLLGFQAKERQEEGTDLDNQRRTYLAMMTNYADQIRALEARVRVQERLLATGLVSQVQLLDTRNGLYQAQHDLARASVQMKQIDVSQLQAEERRRQQRLEKENQLQQGAHQLDYLTNLYQLNTCVRSPYRGNVLEITVKEGQWISANTPILSLQAEAKELEARLYLDPADGKRVGRGMAVAIAPVSVRREEHGLMLGTVRWVAEFPATPQGLLRVLENQALVNEFSQGGAPIEVAVTLERDPHTASGFGWTSAQGPPIKISSGTLCEGSISVASQRPITKVLPVLKRAGL